MRTVAWLREELAKFPDDASCYAYDGEVRGIVIVRGKDSGVIHCSERDDSEQETIPVGMGETQVMSVSKGYLDISPGLLAGLCSFAQDNRTGYLVKVTADAIPSGATVSHVEERQGQLRLWLDGAEPRQYRPQFTAYTPYGTTARIVMVEAASRDLAEQHPSIPRVGEFDGIGTVHSVESEFQEQGRYEVRINYKANPTSAD